MRGPESDSPATRPTVSLKTSEGGENDSFAKPLYWLIRYRGFESLPLRQQHNLQALRNISLRFVLPDIIDSLSQY